MLRLRFGAFLDHTIVEAVIVELMSTAVSPCARTAPSVSDMHVYSWAKGVCVSGSSMSCRLRNFQVLLCITSDPLFTGFLLHFPLFLIVSLPSLLSLGRQT